MAKFKEVVDDKHLYGRITCEFLCYTLKIHLSQKWVCCVGRNIMAEA